MWHCLLLDLHDDAALIAAYRDRHRAVPPAVLASIRAAGIEAMDIYQRDDRLVMMMRTGPGFDPEAKAAADAKAKAAAAGYRVRAYIPYGRDWYAYFSRRIAERPANVMFVLRGMLKG